MKIVNTNNSEHYHWGNGSDGWHLLNSEELSVIEECVPPNDKEERHFHNSAQQFFYILSGVASLEVSGDVYEIHSGSGMHVAAKEPHQLMNKGPVDLRFLVISQPRSHGDRVAAKKQQGASRQ